jgi:hypothetical protein
MSNKTKAYFMEVADFKAFIGVSKLDIYTDKEDPSKKSIKAGSVWINIQKDIDMKGRLVFITDDLLPDGKPNWLKARLINCAEGTRKMEFTESF